MDVPDWAVKITAEVCAEYNQSIPTLTFRQSRKHLRSTGSTYRQINRIVVTFGTAGSDHKQVLLHELAHLVNPIGRHGKEFFIVLKKLLTKYDCLTPEYREREHKSYKISRQYL
jgi:WLM domain